MAEVNKGIGFIPSTDASGGEDDETEPSATETPLVEDENFDGEEILEISDSDSE